MASSLRMAAPKMAQMAAQSARPAFKPVQLQKFARAYSGKLPLDSRQLEDSPTDASLQLPPQSLASSTP